MKLSLNFLKKIFVLSLKYSIFAAYKSKKYQLLGIACTSFLGISDTKWCCNPYDHRN